MPPTVRTIVDLWGVSEVVSFQTIAAIGIVVAFILAGGSQLYGPAKTEYTRIREDWIRYRERKEAEQAERERTTTDDTNAGQGSGDIRNG